MRDNLSNTQMVHLGQVTVSGTTPAASAWVDRAGFDSVTLVMAPATITDAGTAAGFTATLQEGEDSTAAGASDVAAGDGVNGAVTVSETSDSADNSVSGAVGYVGVQQYARLNIVGTTGSDATVDVYALLGHSHRGPATFVGTAVAAT